MNHHSHYTDRQRAALLCQSRIRREVKRIERHWWQIAPDFYLMLNGKLYEELDLPSFAAWCDTIGVSASHGYSLAQACSQPEPVRDSLQGKLSIGLVKLIMPKLQTLESDDEKLELIQHVSEMRWHDARQELNGDDLITKWVESQCPRCKATLELSRNAQVRIK